jgi:hypothetical protein
MGFVSPKTRDVATTSFERDGARLKSLHHAIGAVQTDFTPTDAEASWAIRVKGGQIEIGGAFILYIVFPTAHDALDAIAEGLHVTPKAAGMRVVSKRRIPGFPPPAILLNASTTVPGSGKEGTSSLGFRLGNVWAFAETGGPGRTQQGDVPATLRLARFATRHLNEIRTSLN